MNKSFTDTQIKQACKIAKDTNEELTATQAKLDPHDTAIKALQSFPGFATT